MFLQIHPMAPCPSWWWRLAVTQGVGCFHSRVILKNSQKKMGSSSPFPSASVVPPNEGAWQLNTDAQSRQDIDFIEALIDEISAQHPVDPATSLCDRLFTGVDVYL